jgi:hypothetical protein
MFAGRCSLSAALSLVLSACAASSGQPATRIAEPAIAAAYIPLQKRVHLGIDSDNGAATRIAPGVAVTNAHNANLVDPGLAIAQDRDFDLLFFRSPGPGTPETAAPEPGMAVIAYGQGADGELRIAHGLVRQIAPCQGCGPQAAWFTFAGDAGPGFSGGPVSDEKGRLLGITFGYRDQGRTRLIYAYDMGRVAAEAARLHALESAPKTP